METVIVDAGPPVAYLRQADLDHAWTVERFKELRSPARTCEAALSEAFFLLREQRNGTRQLLALLERGAVIPAFDLTAEMPAVAELMRRYEDVPMSLADACLVPMAELHRNSAVFTLDGDFKIYRKNRRQVIPLISPD
jgi:predicted nucleic acid-binding protein